MEKIIIAEGLSKTFKVHHRESDSLKSSIKSLFKRKTKLVTAVNKIDLTVNRGDIHALIGPNGAGKSTTIKMLSGILHPTSGNITSMGYCPWSNRKKYVKDIGVVFGQKGQLTWELPAIDTYALHKNLYSIPKQKYDENIDYFINTFGIQDIVTKPVRNLSLGERMKCEIVCALLHEPRLVFLDEPTIGLDLISKDIVRSFIRKVNDERGITFILTTHDLAEVESLCNKVTIINHGDIVFNDSIGALKASFSHRKTIEIKLEREIAATNINGFEYKRLSPLSGIIELDAEAKPISSVISELFELLPIKDIDIKSADIETVIKDIYQLGKDATLSNTKTDTQKSDCL